MKKLQRRTTEARRRGGWFVKNQKTPCLRASVVCFCLSFACGYAPVRSRPGQAVRVAAVKNDTAQAEAGGIFAGALRSELAGRGRLDPEGASSPEILLELVSLVSIPTASAGEGAASFRIDALLKLSVGDWVDVVRGGEDYLAGMDVLGTEGNRRAALRRLAATAMHDAIERYDVAQRFKN